MYKAILTLVLILCAANAYSNINRLAVGEFSRMDLSGWDEKSFSGTTDYKIAGEQGQKHLQANANAAASALFKKIKVDLNETPYLNWSWRVDKSLNPINEQTKQGDDYAARIYVIVKRGLTPWKTNALNYVWSSNAQPPVSWPNAFTEKAVMIPLRNQNDSDSWNVEKVNVKHDFKKHFGLDIDRIDGIAIMTDTDNSQSQAIASYGDIYFTAN